MTDLENLEAFLIGASFPYTRDVVPHAQTVPAAAAAAAGAGDDPDGLLFTMFLRTITVIHAGIFDARFSDEGHLQGLGRPGAVISEGSME